MLTVDEDEASTVRTAIPIQIQTGGTYYFGGESQLIVFRRDPQFRCFVELDPEGGAVCQELI